MSVVTVYIKLVRCWQLESRHPHGIYYHWSRGCLFVNPVVHIVLAKGAGYQIEATCFGVSSPIPVTNAERKAERLLVQGIKSYGFTTIASRRSQLALHSREKVRLSASSLNSLVSVYVIEEIRCGVDIVNWFLAVYQ
jgi:hypothetical protein